MYSRLIPALTLLFCATFVQAQAPDVFKGHKDYVSSAAFSADGKKMATASFDETINLWDFPGGKLLDTLKGHKKSVYSVAFSKDGKYLASASQDTTIRLWDPKDGKFIREIKGHTEIVHCVAFSPDSKILASCAAGGTAKDKSVRFWNPEDGKEIKKLGDHKDSVYCVTFSPDGKLLASCSNDGTIKIWDVAEKKELKTLDVETKDDKGKVSKSKDGILVVAFTADSKKVLSGGHDKVLRLWNLEDGKEIKKFEQPDKKKAQSIYGIAVSKDGKNVAVAGYGGNLFVWELESAKEVFKLEQKGRVTLGVAFTPDETALVACHQKGTDKKDTGGIVKVTKLASK